MIDNHCHLFKEYYDNIEEIVQKAKLAGITKIIVNGCDLKTNKEVLELVKKYDIIYGAIGFHPTELVGNLEDNMRWLEYHLNDEKIVAIGEIGLDYHYENTNKKLQQEAFSSQLILAKKYHKPVIIHSRDAIQDTYNLIKSTSIKGVIHCYSGSYEMALEFIKKGFYLGVGGIITYKNSKKLKEIVKNISLNHILLETDSPYLAPLPKRQYPNEPSNIPVIAEEIASLKDVDLTTVIKVTTSNSEGLFDF